MVQSPQSGGRITARLFAGLAIQPFLAGVLTLFTYPLFFPDRHPPANASPVAVALAISLYFGFAALCITFACALPTVVWLARRHRLYLAQSLGFGLAFGNAPVLLAALGGGGGLRVHAFASLLGLVGATAFWFISIRGQNISQEPTAA